MRHLLIDDRLDDLDSHTLTSTAYGVDHDFHELDFPELWDAMELHTLYRDATERAHDKAKHAEQRALDVTANARQLRAAYQRNPVKARADAAARMRLMRARRAK